MHQKNKEHWRAFDANFFEKHQRVLLWFLNTPVIKYWARWIFRILEHDVSFDRNVKKIAPNYISYEEEGDKITSVFRTHDKYSKRLYHAFKPIWWTMHYIDEFFLDIYIPKWSFGFETLEFRPQPNPEGETFDGDVFRNSTSWDTCHDIGFGTSSSDSATTMKVYTGFNNTTGNFFIGRAIMLFDTSSIGAGATVTAGTLETYITAKSNGDNDGDDFTVVVGATPNSNTALVSDDYDEVGDAIDDPTELSGRTDIGSSTTSAYNTDTLNANGLAAVDVDGITKLGKREGHDVLDNPITNAGGTLENSITFSAADETGTSQDPKLTITYTPGSSVGGLVKLASNF